MTTNELFRSLMQQTLDALEKRSRARGWRVSVQCSCDETGTVQWSICVIHEFLKMRPCYGDFVSRWRKSTPDGLVDTVVNAAMAEWDQSRARADELKGETA